MSLSAKSASDRDNAIAPGLLAVKSAIERWARASRDGNKVWEVVGDLLPQMWEDWRFCLSVYEWSQAGNGSGLMGTLTHIAVAVDDQGVAEAVSLAKSAIALYREEI
jgi:hypothetical protein